MPMNEIAEYLVTNAELIKVLAVAIAAPTSLILGIATIAINGYLTRRNISINHNEAADQKRKDREAEIRALRLGLATELDLISEALARRAEGIDNLVGKDDDQQVLTPVPHETPIYNKSGDKLHLLTEKEIRSVASAYVLATAMPEFLLTVGERLKTDSYVAITAKMAGGKLIQHQLYGSSEKASHASSVLRSNLSAHTSST